MNQLHNVRLDITIIQSVAVVVERGKDVRVLLAKKIVIFVRIFVSRILDHDKDVILSVKVFLELEGVFRLGKGITVGSV